MSLPLNLNTNEIKDRTGTEREFLDRGDVEGSRAREWNAATEAPAYPERIRTQHREVGKPGITLRRQSNITFKKTVLSQVDSVTPAEIKFSVSSDIPVGHLTDLNAVKDVCAWMNSFLSSLGVSTTILYDGTGSGSAVLINGTN
jgi:hypothetical protein